MNLLKIGSVSLFFLSICDRPGTASGQSTATDLPIQLHAVRHYGSQALACNGVANTVIERDSFLAQLMGGAHLATTVHRVSFDASSDTQFNVASILRSGEISDRVPYIWAFTSSPAGEVFVLTRWLKPHVSEVTNIVRFDSHGAMEGLIPIDMADRQVLHMARFRDGSFALIAGRVRNSGIDKVEMLIFADDGHLLTQKLLRELSKDESAPATAQRQQIAEEMLARANAKPSAPSNVAKEENGEHTPSSPSALPEAKHPDQEMTALLTRTLLISDDQGDVYMLRPDKPGIIYLLTSEGEVTPFPLEKNANIDPTAREAYTQLIDATVSAGQLILFYSRFDAAPSMTSPYHVVSTFIKTYRLLDGEPTGTYVGDASASGIIPVGWSKDGVSYLRYARDIQPPGVEIVLSTR